MKNHSNIGIHKKKEKRKKYEPTAVRALGATYPTGLVGY